MADQGNTINLGKTTGATDWYSSRNGQYQLRVQGGNLVETGPGGKVVWTGKSVQHGEYDNNSVSDGKADGPGVKLVFKKDNDNGANRLVLEDANGHQVWPDANAHTVPGKEGKSNNNAVQFVLEDDGSLVAYDSTDPTKHTPDHVVWSTGYSGIGTETLVTPQNASSPFIAMINGANSHITTLVNTLGSSNEPSLPNWAYTDQSALSAAYDVVASYNAGASGVTQEADQNALTYIKNHTNDAADQDGDMAGKLQKLALSRGSAFVSIDKTIADINDKLNAISNSTAMISPSVEASLYPQVGSAVTAVVTQVSDYADYSKQLAGKPPASTGTSTGASTGASTGKSTGQSTGASTAASTPQSTWQQGYEAGRQSVTTGGNDYYTGNPDATDAADTTDTGSSAIDFSNLFGDLTGSSTLDGSGLDTAGTSYSYGTSADGQLTDATGTGSGTTTATPAAATDTASTDPTSGIVQAMELSSLMNNTMKPQSATTGTGETGSGGQNPDDNYGDDQGQYADNAQYADSSNAADAYNPPAVSAPATAETPPPVSTGSTVDVPMPNGLPTQHVSSTVAEALQRELHGSAATADAAYAGTPGASTADHRWTTISDLQKLATGDVVKWADGSDSILVKSGGDFYYIDNHQLVPLDTGNPQGNHGAFQGFFHPAGVDSPADPAGDPVTLNASSSAVVAAAEPPPVSSTQDPSSPIPPRA